MDLTTLHKYYEMGWLIKQTHPTLPLTIWNYSQQTQYEGMWDEITLVCRGLVTDDKGTVVARPFKKFFNIEEEKHSPTKEFEVYENMDGSLGILFNYNKEWIWATRGSFTSEQAIKAKEIFEKEHSYDDLNDRYTYLFEIIYPENRIVVNYGKEEKLVLLGKINTTSGQEVGITKYELKNINIVNKYYNVNDCTKLKKAILPGNKGFVVKFSNGDRCKIKGEEYIRLHRVMTNLSTISIWEALRNDEDIYELLKDVPDEFFDKIDEYVEELKSKFELIEERALARFATLQIYTEERSEFAKYAKLSPLEPILFKMLDNRDYSNTIWKMIKPEYRKL